MNLKHHHLKYHHLVFANIICLKDKNTIENKWWIQYFDRSLAYKHKLLATFIRATFIRDKFKVRYNQYLLKKSLKIIV